MKKLLLFSAISLSTLAFAQHPTDKGWRSVGGTGNLYFDFDGSDGTFNRFELGPEVYWFVGNSFGLGTDFGFSMNSNKMEQSDTVTFRSQSISMWVAPGFRFYMREPEKAWRPYIFANAGFQYSGSHSTTDYDNSAITDLDSKSSTSGFRGYGGVGMAWFFSDHAAFDIRARLFNVYPGFNDQGEKALEFGYSPSIMIGVQAFFD
ncbi:MAG TPA: outer membrane beta-barrel protein [Bacteroidia bacterium]|nr:outer membrane beta-barrel protein [Bacteroidia bacterium]